MNGSSINDNTQILVFFGSIIVIFRQCYSLKQACTTYGLRAKCGPRKLVIWPAKPIFLCFHLVCSRETPFERVKRYNFGPLNITQSKFWPAKRFELCAPDLKLTFFSQKSYTP